MSSHAIEIVEVGEILPHGNADSLEITYVLGWQCVVRKESFWRGDKAVYIPPDYLVPTCHPSLSFLRKKEGQVQSHIRVCRLRGEISQGLLIPVPPELAGLPVGSNVIAELGIKRYEPPEQFATGGMFVTPPAIYTPKFDIENIQRYPTMLDGAWVVVTEKLHGANARFVYYEGTQYCGSRTNWIADDEKNIWWRAYRAYPAIGRWCQANPAKVLYGEIFGPVQSLRYGAEKNVLYFAAFAALDHNRWMDYVEFRESVDYCGVHCAPLLYNGKFDLNLVREFAEKDSVWLGAKHCAEGVVVVPEIERVDAEIGRVALKCVSNRYLMGEYAPLQGALTGASE